MTRATLHEPSLGDLEEALPAALVALGDAPLLGVLAGFREPALGLLQPLAQLRGVELARARCASSTSISSRLSATCM